MTRHPNFDFDLAYGKEGETRARRYLELWADGNTKVEVKRKDRSDSWFYIETEHDPGRTGTYRPSGLSISEADLWAFVISDTGIAVYVPRRLLELAIEWSWGKPIETTKGSCPTHGTLLGFHELVEVVPAYATIEKAPRCRICHRPMLVGQGTTNRGSHYSCAREDAS